jgi:hypothetical protein
MNLSYRHRILLKEQSHIKVTKTIPVTDRRDLQSCEMLEIPHCIHNRLTDGGDVISLTRRPRSTSRNIFWHSFLLEVE